MEIKVLISVEDLTVITDNMDYLKSLFSNFKIISEHFVIDDQYTMEQDGEIGMFEFKEVIFQLNSMNNFWALAKFVQQLKIEKL